ncbi:MAG: zinc ABC transporter substrate-binding protein [Wolbachia endosymbiont of Tyrophagus putrescentiae]|nr:zinc ABC transporter substrate-binding protein [Wolbachia endosymbiont of Tyrophagus putrescentiae]
MKHVISFLLLFFSILYYNTAFSSNLKIVATIKPVHSLVSSVTDGIVDSALLNYNTTSAHDYTLKPSDISKLESSNIIFYINDELETFVKNFKKNNRQLIQLSDAVTLLPARQNSFARKIINTHNEDDLHIWLNPENAKLMIRFISTKLSEIDSNNSNKYKNNAEIAIKKIEQKAKEISNKLNSVKGQKYIVLHDAYQYFEKHFGLNPPSVILAIEEDSYIGIKSLTKLREIMKQENISCVLSHSWETPKAFPNNAKVMVLDPTGLDVEPGKDAYLTIIDDIAKNFKSCFIN